MIEAEPLPPQVDGRARLEVEGRILARRLAAGVHEQTARRTAQRLAERALDGDPPGQAWVLRHDGALAGMAWTSSGGDGRSYLVDLDVPDDAVAESLRSVVSRLRDAGQMSLAVDVTAHEPALASAVAALDGGLQATQMQLSLEDLPASPPRVALRAMSGAEWEDYRTAMVGSYAQDLFDSGAFLDLETATRSAEQQTADLLPDGLDSPGHHLWTAYDGDVPVAVLWIHVDGPAAFIYDIEVRAEQRRRGYGREVLDAGARAARELGAEVLGLNVFGHNDGARVLYEKAGYATTERTYRIAL